MAMGQFGLTRRGVLALPMVGLSGSLGATPVGEDLAKTEASNLAKQAIELPRAALSRLLWKFCTFDIPETTVLMDRVYVPPLNQAEEQRLNFNLVSQRAATIAYSSMAHLHRVANFPSPNESLVLGSLQRQVNPVLVLQTTLEQMADLDTGLNVEWGSPWPTKMRFFRVLKGTRRLRPNATKDRIEGALLGYLRDKGNTAITNGMLLSIATTCAQLGSGVLGQAAMARVDLTLEQYGGNQQDLANEVSYFGLLCLEFGDLAGARNTLNRLASTTERFELAIGIAVLEVRQIDSATGLRRLNELSEAVLKEQVLTAMERVNRIQILVTTFVELRQQASANACAVRFVKQLRELTRPDLYVLATMSVVMLYLGEREVAIELCQRGSDIYRQTAPPSLQPRASAPIAAGYQQLNDGSGYPSHYYLAFSAYWAGLTVLFDSIAQPLPADRRETFWVWFLDMGMNLNQESPPYEQATSKGGPGLWVSALRRSIVQGRSAESLAMIPIAVESLCSSNFPRKFQDLMTIARLARRLSRPNLAEGVLESARKTAKEVIDTEKRIDALLLILQTEQAFARSL